MTKTCAWIGEGEGCDHLAVDGRSYCDEHLWRVYQQGTQLSRRKKDQRVANSVREWEDLFNSAVEELENEGFL